MLQLCKKAMSQAVKCKVLFQICTHWFNSLIVSGLQKRPFCVLKRPLLGSQTGRLELQYDPFWSGRWIIDRNEVALCLCLS